MTQDVYRKLAGILDTLPNGFPPTDDGLELRILEKIFTPAEAELCCDLRLTTETPVQIAERTGRPLEGLDEMLTTMWNKGQIWGIEFGPARAFKMAPWVIGIWEFQVDRMDEELATLCQEYYDHFGKEFFSTGPQLMRSIPVGVDLTPTQQAMPYDAVSGIIEKGQSFAVNDCVCRKEERILGNNCELPLEVCLSVAPVPGIFEKHPWGRPISRDEAYAVLQEAADAGLIHMTSNVESGHAFICNCCGCCCGVLKGITKLGMSSVVNSDYYSQIAADECNVCGLCSDDVCQVGAIVEGDDAFEVDRKLCVGCGQCVDACPYGGITLQRKPEAERIASPANEDAWLDQRGEARGIDFSQHK